MEAFKDQVLEQAIIARAQSLPKPSWLSAAQSAVLEFQAGEASEERAAGLHEALAKIPDWPKTREQVEASLLEVAEPIQSMLAKAFCSIGQDDEGRPIARLWGGDGSIAVRDGRLELISKKSQGLFQKRSAESLFADSGWDGTGPASVKGQGVSASIRKGPMFISFTDEPAPMPLAAISEGIIQTDRFNAEEETRVERALGAAQVNLQSGSERAALDKGRSQGIEARASAGKTDFAKDLGSSLLGIEPDGAHQKALDRIAERDWRKRSSLMIESYGVDVALRHMRNEAPSQQRRRDATLLFPLDSSGSMSQVDKLFEFEASIKEEGIERAIALKKALLKVGPETLIKARARAGLALMSFLEEQAPGTRAAASVAKAIWGAPLSLEASDSAASWAPMAAQLMKEDPRRALLTLAIAPALGLSPSSSLLSESKAALKKMGLPESVWKELGALPQQDFDGILASFKKAAESRGPQSDLFGMNFQFSGLPRAENEAKAEDPFSQAAVETPERMAGRKVEMERVAAALMLMSQAARLAGLPLTRAVGFCSKDGAARAPAWAEPVEKKPAVAAGGTTIDIGALVAEFAVGFGAAKTAGASFLSLCDRKLAGELPLGPEGEMERLEREAVRSRAPKVLALAMSEAMSRPLREVLAELEDLNDWLKRSEPGLWQQLPEKMSWASLRRREEAWHKELQAAKDAEFKSPWDRVLDEPVKAEGRVARELESGAELFEEGKAMSHCVSTYAQDCRDGSSRIYSITDESGERVATLEARFEPQEDGSQRAWAAQLRGRCNQRVTDQGALKASEEVIKALNAKLEAVFKEQVAAQEGGAVEEPASESRSVLEALALRRQGQAPAEAPRIAPAGAGARGV